MKYGTYKMRKVSWAACWYQFRVSSLLATILISSWAICFFEGQLHAPIRVEAQTVTNTITIPDTSLPPVLGRIAYAETRDNQTCDEDAVAHHYCQAAAKGTTLVTANSNGSVDVVAYAINNETWGAAATKLGYDIYTPGGNTAMAEWILTNYGTAPWYLSRGRWNQ